MEEPVKRNSGAPRGNRNAVKHGFYSREFNKAERKQYLLASDMEGITEEIALLRYKIKKAVTEGNIKNLVPLVKAAGALEKLIRTNYRINGAKEISVEHAIENVIANFASWFPEDERKDELIKLKQWKEAQNK